MVTRNGFVLEKNDKFFHYFDINVRLTCKVSEGKSAISVHFTVSSLLIHGEYHEYLKRTVARDRKFSNHLQKKCDLIDYKTTIVKITDKTNDKEFSTWERGHFIWRFSFIQKYPITCHLSLIFLSQIHQR